MHLNYLKSFKIHLKRFRLHLTIHHMVWYKHPIIIYTMKAAVIYHLKPDWFVVVFILSNRTENESENFPWMFLIYFYFRTLKSRSSITGPHWRSWLSLGVGTTSGSGPWSCSFTIPPIFFWRLILYCICMHLSRYWKVTEHLFGGLGSGNIAGWMLLWIIYCIQGLHNQKL